MALDISAIITDNRFMNYNYQEIQTALRLLDGRLGFNKSGRFILAVCGGTALNALKLVTRTTKDVGDIKVKTLKFFMPVGWT